ncbi:MAG: hypothetical protein BWY15_01147 [Firmicutes bacterium ADurb.Bin193]|nr:MAG: hypothetical protein BWY15_01147 [Firmicutes bacterium ADurb.Bin193]
MAVEITNGKSQDYINILKEAAREIEIRAEEIIGDINGQKGIGIFISIQPHEITEISVNKVFVSGWKQQKSEQFNDAERIDT